MSLLAQTFRRLAVAGSICAIAFMLVYIESTHVIGLALIGASLLCLPFIVSGSLLWGPKGLAVRLYGLDPARAWVAPRHFSHGLFIVGVGVVLSGHFTASPYAAAFGFLLALASIELQLSAADYKASSR
jgi:hypothetical protein